MKQKQKKDEISLEYDEQGNPLMSSKNVKIFNAIDGLPETPQLNDKLYLYEKGFAKIQLIPQFYNVSSLWLNSNKIVKMENLEVFKNLIQLYLNNNQIGKIEGLDQLRNLQILNLNKNRIETIENLQPLTNLKSFSIAQNRLTNYNSIQKLGDIKTLNNLDLTRNQLQNNKQILQILKKLTQINCLSLKSTPFARQMKNYRKLMIASLKKIKFLDDRPVLQSDHRLCEAWLAGGADEEKKQKTKMQNEESIKKIKQRQQFEKQKQQRSTRIERKSKPQKNDQRSNNNRQKILASNQKSPNSTNFVSEQEKGYQMDQIQKQLGQIKQNNEKIENSGQKQVQLQLLDTVQNNTKNTHYKAWTVHYQPLLQALLVKHKFDFEQVQPQFNMIIAQINKKLANPGCRFQIEDLQKIWTDAEIRRRKQQSK